MFFKFRWFHISRLAPLCSPPARLQTSEVFEDFGSLVLTGLHGRDNGLIIELIMGGNPAEKEDFTNCAKYF
jgi:hypothetical protein